jgi:hypothetical protein
VGLRKPSLNNLMFIFNFIDVDRSKFKGFPSTVLCEMLLEREARECIVLENISLQVESADLITARLCGGLPRFDSGL